MLDKILNIIVWLSEINTRSYEPIINEYRGYQRRMVASAVGALFVLIVSWIFLPQQVPNNDFMAILVTAVDQVRMILDFVALILCIFFLFNLFEFWRFCTRS